MAIREKGMGTVRGRGSTELPAESGTGRNFNCCHKTELRRQQRACTMKRSDRKPPGFVTERRIPRTYKEIRRNARIDVEKGEGRGGGRSIFAETASVSSVRRER